MTQAHLFSIVAIFAVIASVAHCESSIRQLPSSITFFQHSAFPKTHLFCRIHGVCRVGDSTILLPTWMQFHAEQIANCGLMNVSYSITTHLNSSSSSPSLHFNSANTERSKQPQAMVWSRTTSTHSNLTMHLSDEFRDHDILGGPTPSADRHHLATTITPLIHLLDLFSTPSSYNPHLTASYVHPPPNSPFPSQPLPRNPTDLSHPEISSMSSIMLIDSRLADTKEFQWPKSILRLLRSSQSGNFRTVDHRELYSWKVRSKASCFRSILSTSAKTSDFPESAISTNNLFFSENGLVRTSTTVKQQHAIANCTVKVLILNRYGKRFIEGTELLTSAISAFASVLRNQAPHVNIQPEVVFFENSSFHEQVSIVQEAGVIVATHGESNANFMFARPDTHVFEILPFGYRPKEEDYQNLSKAYGVQYTKVTAQPDKHVFAACVRHFNPIRSEDNVKVKVSERERFLKSWNLYADTFRNGTVEHGRNILSSFVVPDEIRQGESGTSTGDGMAKGREKLVVEKIRECAGYQRVSVDVRDLARIVVVTAARQCPFHTDLTMLQT